MRYGNVRWGVLGLLLAALLGGCSRKQPDGVMRLGSDTLTLHDVNRFVPDKVSDTAYPGDAVVRLALAYVVPDSADSVHRARRRALGDQLSLQGETQWSDTAAGVLLEAAQALAARMQQSRSKADVAAYADSLFAGAALRKTAYSVGARMKADTLLPESLPGVSREIQAIVIARVLNLPDKLATVAAEFLETPGAGSVADVNELVKGLISSGAEKKTGSSSPRVPELEKDNSFTAMKYRSQGSIRDSISRHIPNLQALYKKHLKAHEGSGGTVWVTLRLDAAGKVIDAGIKSSDIRDAGFTGPLLSYVKTIGFQPIPAKVGTMRFDFPFEFSAEN